MSLLTWQWQSPASRPTVNHLAIFILTAQLSDKQNKKKNTKAAQQLEMKDHQERHSKESGHQIAYL